MNAPRCRRWSCADPSLVRRRAHDVLIDDDLALGLLLALKIEVADAERARAVVDPEYAAFLLVAGGDEAVFARLLLGRAVAAAIASRHAIGAWLDLGLVRVEIEFAGDDVAGELVQAVDERKIDLRRGEEFVLAARGRGARRGRQRQSDPEKLQRPHPGLARSESTRAGVYHAARAVAPPPLAGRRPGVGHLRTGEVPANGTIFGVCGGDACPTPSPSPSPAGRGM